MLELIHYSAPGATAPYVPAHDERARAHPPVDLGRRRAGHRREGREYGGEIIEASDLGLALFIRDPDGQLLELLPATVPRPACRRKP